MVNVNDLNYNGNGLCGLCDLWDSWKWLMNHILVIVNGNVNYTGLLKWLELYRFLHKKTVKMGFLKKFIKIIRIH